MVLGSPADRLSIILWLGADSNETSLESRLQGQVLVVHNIEGCLDEARDQKNLGHRKVI